MTIGDIIAPFRATIKALKQDAFVTDRQLWSITKRALLTLIKREDGQYKVMRHRSLFSTLDYVRVEETDAIEAGCMGISVGTIMYRTEELPVFWQGYSGPLIREVTSLDGTVVYHMTTPEAYRNLNKTSSFKYNKKKYCWWLNGRLYFPDAPPAVRVVAITDGDVSSYKCQECKNNRCLRAQDREFNLPQALLSEVEQLIMPGLRVRLSLPPDINKDNINPAR